MKYIVIFIFFTIISQIGSAKALTTRISSDIENDLKALLPEQAKAKGSINGNNCTVSFQQSPINHQKPGEKNDFRISILFNDGRNKSLWGNWSSKEKSFKNELRLNSNFIFYWQSYNSKTSSSHSDPHNATISFSIYSTKLTSIVSIKDSSDNKLWTCEVPIFTL